MPGCSEERTRAWNTAGFNRFCQDYDWRVPSRTVLSPALRAVTVRRRGEHRVEDLVVVEEPLEIRLDGKPLVVTMRTPGNDEELAAGFLHAEGLIADAAGIASLRAVAGDGASGPDGQARIRVTRFAGDRVEITRADSSAGPALTAMDQEREFRATAACGVCGKSSIDELDQEVARVATVAATPDLIDRLEALPGRLRAAQSLFDATGGIHAAGIFSMDGELSCVREDIGRHNAVDKAIGHYVLRDATPLDDHILVVSGRAGFELVQKALAARIPLMVAVGAASSVAVEMASAAGMTLYSFAGRGRGNLHLPPEDQDQEPTP